MLKILLPLTALVLTLLAFPAHADLHRNFLPLPNASGCLGNDGSGGLSWVACSGGGGGSGVDTIGAFGSSPNTGGASISSTTLTLQPADATRPGGVTAGTQTFGGVKTFTSPVFITPALGTPASGVATNLTGTASGLTAGSVTTNADLTGVITSTGNATSIASQTGTGTKFVVDTSPTLVTPNLGTPSALVGTNISGTGASFTAGAATLAAASTLASTTATNSTNATFFPAFVASSSSSNQAIDTATGLTFNPSSNTLTTTTFAGALTGAASLNVLKAGDTMTGQLINSTNGAASTPPLLLSGTWFTGGSATTTKPAELIEPAGTTTTAWSTSGTGLGVNAPSGFAGNLADLQINGVSKASFDSLGLLVQTNGSETSKCGMSSGTRYTCNNSTHGGSVFLTYATNTGGLGIGIGAFNNNYLTSISQASTSTAPSTGIAGGAYTVPILNLRNSNSTAGNYSALAFSGSSDNPTSYIAGVNVTQTSSSEGGRIVLGTTSAGTRTDKIKLEPAGQISHGGTAPTVGTCGTSPTIVGNDVVGRITVGTGGVATSCTVTFAATWANAPICVIADESTALLVTPAPTTTALVITAATPFGASDKIGYHCTGYF